MGLLFVERCRCRERSVEEALIEMYLVGVFVRCLKDITEALWGRKVSSSTISELNKKAAHEKAQSSGGVIVLYEVERG